MVASCPLPRQRKAAFQKRYRPFGVRRAVGILFPFSGRLDGGWAEIAS
jgi:hypothetical protein